MHFMFPHVLSTETESNPETTMGFTCQSNSNYIYSNNLIKSDSKTTRATAISSVVAPRTTTAPPPPNKCKHMEWWQRKSWPLYRTTTRLKFAFELLWQFKWKQHQRQKHKYISVVLRIVQKTKRTTNSNIVPSCRTWCRLRWTFDQLCAGTKVCNRRRRSSRNCLSPMALGRFTLCRRAKTDTSLPKRNGSHLCLLQSNALVSALSLRYSKKKLYLLVF